MNDNLIGNDNLIDDDYVKVTNTLIKSIYENFKDKQVNYQELLTGIIIGLLSVYDTQVERDPPDEAGDTAYDIALMVCEELQNRGYFT